MKAAEFITLVILGVLAGAAMVYAMTGSMEIAIGLFIGFIIVSIVAINRENKTRSKW